MLKPLRFGSAISAVALATVIGGCAAQTGPRSASIFGEVADESNLALATRAAAALAAKEYDQAVSLAERAVEKSPRDAGFRSLLGNAYFASGRFASAEAAYKDSLALIPNRPEVVLKLALVQIALGKGGEAVALLDAARPYLDASNYGLALALAGDPARAVTVLDPAAREMSADAQLRQNLALAYALNGDWVAARTVASQDLSPAFVDARIQEWMAFAKADRPSDQVAALTGVQPAAVDPGQPTRLALQDSGARMAAADPATVPVAAPEPQVEVAMAEAYSPPSPPPPMPPMRAPVAMAESAPPAPPEVAPPAPVIRPAAFVPAKPDAKPAAKPAALARRDGSSTAVVQLGAFSSQQGVAAAWDQFARRYPTLQGYTPMSAQFATGNRTLYRLSVRGFAGVGDAKALCEDLQRKGKNCFVRSLAGDTPVRIASR